MKDPIDASVKSRSLEPLEFGRWIEGRRQRLAERWLSEVRARQSRWDPEVEALLGRFFTLLTSMLPATLGPFREHVDPLWLQTAELYGSVAAQRGLAAGEPVEEFQILREVLVRELYADPPGGAERPLPLRDVLRLNRAIDRGVTQSSVGHADVLFFALFQGSGVPEHLDTAVKSEVAEQLNTIGEELSAVLDLRRR